MITCAVVRVGTTSQEAIDLRSGYPDGNQTSLLLQLARGSESNGQAWLGQDKKKKKKRKEEFRSCPGNRRGRRSGL